MIFEGSWQLWEVSEDCKKANVTRLQEGQEGESGELKAGCSHLGSLERGGANNHGNYFQTSERQEGDWE